MKALYKAVTGLLLLSSSMMQVAMAQDQAPPAQFGAMQQRTPDEVVNNLAAKLNLTDDQKNQIRPMIADRQQRMAALRSDTSMRPMQKMRTMRDIFQDSDKKIKTVLNDQQRQQYIQLEQQMRDQIRQRMQNRGSMGESPQ